MTADWTRSPGYDGWPGCRQCVHLRDDGESCTAYPAGIPLPIASGQVDHLVERPGQVAGVIFHPGGTDPLRQAVEALQRAPTDI